MGAVPQTVRHTDNVAYRIVSIGLGFPSASPDSDYPIQTVIDIALNEACFPGPCQHISVPIISVGFPGPVRITDLFQPASRLVFIADGPSRLVRDTLRFSQGRVGVVTAFSQGVGFPD